jgi:Dyp-type peroxidase family
MAARAELLDDTGRSDPAGWEDALSDGVVHLLLTVHARSRRLLAAEVERIEERLRCRSGLARGQPQVAHVLTNADGATHEHFGFVDGFGQPAIAGSDAVEYPGQGVPKSGRLRALLRRLTRTTGWRPLAAGEFVLGYRDEDGVVAEAPAQPFGRNGTFMVVRKLGQDVAAFRRLIRDIAREHWSDDEALAGAKIVGRWCDGTPLARSTQRPDPELAGDRKRVNDFCYAADPGGRACPVGAHIRRANPRDGLVGGAIRTRRHRIVRRGMPYGSPLPAGADDDQQRRGLMFVCFNASILRQFEVVNRWLHDGDAFGLGDERDYLTAARDERGDTMVVQGDPPAVLRSHPPLVWTLGGEYLFMPGLVALRALADADGLPPPAPGGRLTGVRAT